MSQNVDKLIYLALIAKQANSFDDMRKFLEEYILKLGKVDITSDERNLLSLAYKSCFFSKKHSICTLVSYEMKENQFEDKLAMIHEYKSKVEGEIIQFCEHVTQFILVNLLNYARDTEAKVFYLKLIADYYRYIAENVEDVKKEIYSDKSLNTYMEAHEKCNELKVTNHVRLGLALNFSILYYDVINNRHKGIVIAQQALELVKNEIENLDEYDDNNTDTFHVIQMLQDNLSLWSFESKFQ